VTSLAELFQQLALPAGLGSEGAIFCAAKIPGHETFRLAKDAAGHPVILVPAQVTAGEPASPTFRLQHLEIEHRIRCRLWLDGSLEVEGLFTILRCPSPNPSVRNYFLTLCEPIVATLGAAPTEAQVADLVEGLVELFRALAEPARSSVQGVWAELFLIKHSNDPIAMARAWHGNPTEKFDFMQGAQRIEVKSSSSRNRRHHFSLDQITPPQGVDILVASLFVERAAGGTSLRYLMETVRQRLLSVADMGWKVDTVVASVLGSTFALALDECFDEEVALQSLVFYRATDIPRPPGSMPQSVTDVRFLADIGAVPIAPPSYASHPNGTLFQAWRSTSPGV
jgi:hypothetical protein